MKQGLLVLSLLACVIFCEKPEKEAHFYCRKCGTLIANYSSLIDKKSENAQFRGELENQEGEIHVHYDQFDSNVIFRPSY